MKEIVNRYFEKGQEKSKLNEDLIASEVRYRRLFESAKDGILILDALTGMIIDVNPFLINLLGYSKHDFEEKAIWEIGFLKDIIENKEKFAELQQSKYVRYEDLPLKTSTGTKIHVEFVSNVYIENQKEVIQCNIRDITERKRAEEELTASNEKFRIIAEHSADAIFITDAEGRCVYANSQAVNLLGYSIDELSGFTIRDISPKNKTRGYFLKFQKLLKTGSFFEEIELVKKNGETINSDLNAVLLPNGLIYGSCRDITLRKKAEEELIRAKEKAEESERLKSAFLANMSHEIRTPMNGILGFAELLKNMDLNGEQQKQYISIIEKSGARLLNIINDIICISKIESEQITAILADTNINELMEFIYNFFKPETNQKNLHFSYHNAFPDKDVILLTDREKVYAILTNLVKNAIKFTQSGYIDTGYTVKNGFIEFYVSDSGPGIPDNQREYIFERFRQGSETLTRNNEGAGLGLSISKAYVEMLGGKIWIENRATEPSLNGNGEKTGSVFYFTIPARFSNKTNTIVPVNLIDDETKGISKKLKILIVEDDLNSELLLKIYLKIFAKEILDVSNGFEAVEICKKNDDIDLVIMDLNIPGINGYEATRMIRKFNRNVIIIAQTAYALNGDREKAVEAGCNSYISKPVSHLSLRKLINKHFNKPEIKTS